MYSRMGQVLLMGQSAWLVHMVLVYEIVISTGTSAARQANWLGGVQSLLSHTDILVRSLNTGIAYYHIDQLINIAFTVATELVPSLGVVVFMCTFHCLHHLFTSGLNTTRDIFSDGLSVYPAFGTYGRQSTRVVICWVMERQGNCKGHISDQAVV